MRRTIVHIGMHKTGTTSIQEALKGYDDGRVAVSSLSDPSHDPAILTLFGNEPINSHPARWTGLTSANYAAERERLSRLLEADLQRRDRDILYSAEGMSHPNQSAAIAGEFIPVLRRNFDRLDVFAGVRSPASFMAAALDQRLRTHAAVTDWQVVWPAYETRFAVWEAAVDRMIWRPYDRRGQDAVAVFAEALSLNLSAQGQRLNEAGGLYQTAVHYAQRRLGRPLTESTAHLDRLLALQGIVGRLPYRPFRIAPASFAVLMEQNAADFAWMAERVPGLDPRPVDDAGEGRFDLAAPDDLLEVAAGLLEQVRAFAPGFRPKRQGRAEQVAEGA